MKDAKLEPCPFCGRRYARLEETNAPEGFRVVCGTCCARTDIMIAANMAANMWNMRLAPVEIDAVEEGRGSHEHL